MTDGGASQAQLEDELRSLRDSVAALQQIVADRPRLTLSANRQQAFLGQPVMLTARVTAGAANRALAGVPVLFLASWGRLRAVDPEQAVEHYGSGVTARTGYGGQARAAFLPPSSETLQPGQQAALESELGRLNADAAAPSDIVDQLRSLVTSYQWENSVQLRRAVDVYCRDFRQNLLDAILDVDQLQAWSIFPANVVAYVCPSEVEGEAASEVQAVGALTLRFKDWLAPFIQVFESMARADPALLKELNSVKEAEADPERMVDGVYGQVQAYFTGQRGRIGAHAAQVAVESSLKTFVATGLGDLPLETRQKLFPTLRLAADTTAATAVGAVAGLTQTRLDLHQDLGNKADLAFVETGLRGKADQTYVDTGLKAKVDQVYVDGALSSKADLTYVDTGLKAKADQVYVDTALSSKAEQTYVDTGLQAKADQVYVDSGLKAKADQVYVDGALSSKADLTYVDTGLKAKADQVYVDSGLKAKADQVYVDTALSSKADGTYVDAGLKAKADQVYVDSALSNKTDQTYVDTGLKAKADQVYVDSALSNKADQVYVDSGLKAKADQTYVDAGLSSKADGNSLVTLSQQVGDLAKQREADRAAFDQLNSSYQSDQKTLSSLLGVLDANFGRTDSRFTELDKNFGQRLIDMGLIAEPVLTPGGGGVVTPLTPSSGINIGRATIPGGFVGTGIGGPEAGAAPEAMPEEPQPAAPEQGTEATTPPASETTQESLSQKERPRPKRRKSKGPP